MIKKLYWLCGLVLGALQAPAQPDTAQVVYTGVHLMNLYDLDINAYSYYADFYLWFRWKGERNPMDIEFVNAVEKWGFTQNDFSEEPVLLEDGSYYHGMRIEGRFYHAFVLNAFPLDRHRLEMRIENVTYPLDSLVYVPDTSGHLWREDLVIPGWRIEKGEFRAHTNQYRTNFGETGRRAESFSNFEFALTIARPLSYFLLKLLLPLLVVISASLGALFIHPQYLEARVSLPIGGLLSCVFLQQSYSSALPDVGYMVLMDRIYLVSYLLIALIMWRVMLAGNRLLAPAAADPPRLARADRRSAAVFLLLYLLLLLALIGGGVA